MHVIVVGLYLFLHVYAYHGCRTLSIHAVSDQDSFVIHIEQLLLIIPQYTYPVWTLQNQSSSITFSTSVICPDITEKMLTGMLNLNTNKQKYSLSLL